ncbi:hypothetical protein [Dyadobacter psychrotolerans]|uniref:Uncharacterized protein n=1 Tax=Dyadobacter psychrotolerans TaxID=2541721 RepID=A0A4R5DJU1_9BACT|nr:hypothetical protein [Dyadobacter psychrotolerans]TDE14412.1 hypothetical protein E0F88_14520 [Dyadobacter psychrotolerans]
MGGYYGPDGENELRGYPARAEMSEAAKMSKTLQTLGIRQTCNRHKVPLRKSTLFLKLILV